MLIRVRDENVLLSSYIVVEILNSLALRSISCFNPIRGIIITVILELEREEVNK